MKPELKRFLQTWAVNTAAVLVAVFVIPGIRFDQDSYWTPFVTSLVLGILNAFIRPILMLMVLPLLILTLGLFTLVINALLLMLVGAMLKPHFVVDDFWSALLGAIVIAIVSGTLNVLTGNTRSRIKFEARRGRGPSTDRRPPPKGDGPVIDV